MFVRVSTGHFDPAVFATIDALLRDGGARLIPAIRKLPGCLHYYAGINEEASTIVNVSLWDSLEHAQQMSALTEMHLEGDRMRAAGARFEPIVNYETAWEITP